MCCTVESMPQFDCTRCGWCCNHVMVKLPRAIQVSHMDREWMDARGIKIFKGQMVIPSRCGHLGAEQINTFENDGIFRPNNQGEWVCTCRIQSKKPVVCSSQNCIKNKYPGIDKI